MEVVGSDHRNDLGGTWWFGFENNIITECAKILVVSIIDLE